MKKSTWGRYSWENYRCGAKWKKMFEFWEREVELWGRRSIFLRSIKKLKAVRPSLGASKCLNLMEMFA